MSYEELFVRLLLENLRGKPRQVSAIAFQISSAYIIAYPFSNIKLPYMNILVLPLTIVLWMITLISNWWLFNKVSIDEVAKDVVSMLPEVIKELKEDISIEAYINSVIEKLRSFNKISIRNVFKVFAVIAIPYILTLVSAFLFIERVLGLPIMNLQGMYLATAVACIAFTYEFLSALPEAEVHGDIMGIAEHELVRNVFDVTMPRFTMLTSIVKGAFGRKLSKIPMKAAIMLNDLCTPSPIISFLTHENEKDNDTPMVIALIPCNELAIKEKTKESKESSVVPLVNELMTQCIENLRTALSSLGAQPLCMDRTTIDSIVNNLRTILRSCSRKSPNSGVSVHEKICDVGDVAGVPQLLSARLLQCITKALIEFPGRIENDGSLMVLTLLMKNFEIKYQVNESKGITFIDNTRGLKRFKIKGFTCKPQNGDTVLRISIIATTGIYKANLNLVLIKQLAGGHTNNPNPNAPERRGTP